MIEWDVPIRGPKTYTAMNSQLSCPLQLYCGHKKRCASKTEEYWLHFQEKWRKNEEKMMKKWWKNDEKISKTNEIDATTASTRTCMLKARVGLKNPPVYAKPDTKKNDSVNDCVPSTNALESRLCTTLIPAMVPPTTANAGNTPPNGKRLSPCATSRTKNVMAVSINIAFTRLT